MILECPSCTARFLVADALVPPAGRTVRCGACKNQWFVEPAQPLSAAPVMEEVAPGMVAESAAPALPETPVEKPAENVTVDFATLAEATPAAATPAPSMPRQLPVVKKHKLPLWPFVTAASVLAASWAMLAFVAYFPKGQYAPLVSGLYRATGTIPTDGLVFQEMTMEKQKREGRTQFVLAGSIANTADKRRVLPKVRVELRDATSNVLWKRNYPVNQSIKPGEVFPFRIEDVQTSFGDKVATVTVDIGNSLELAVR